MHGVTSIRQAWQVSGSVLLFSPAEILGSNPTGGMDIRLL